MKTYHQKASEVQRDWLVIDANAQVLGRLATQISKSNRCSLHCEVNNSVVGARSR